MVVLKVFETKYKGIIWDPEYLKVNISLLQYILRMRLVLLLIVLIFYNATERYIYKAEEVHGLR